MSEPESGLVAAPGPRVRRPLTLWEYVRRRNGVPAGAAGSLRTMLRRSLGAGTFAGFWRYWNPIFGYGLGRFVYQPLRRFLPRAAALVLTFVACGALHDLVMVAAGGSMVFLFTPWFLFLALGVLGGSAAGLDLSGRPWALRALANLVYVGTCLAAALLARDLLPIP